MHKIYPLCDRTKQEVRGACSDQFAGHAWPYSNSLCYQPTNLSKLIAFADDNSDVAQTNNKIVFDVVENITGREENVCKPEFPLFSKLFSKDFLLGL